MCGIAGSLNLDFSYEKLSESMGHRGPDACKGYRHHTVNLFHLRLSIMDIAGGSQPMELHDRFVIVFNGEIYNHLELRTRFGLTGHTHSDTETLLMLYEKEGAGFLDAVDGMFAFAIYDKQDHTLFLARDRAGKKPLYYYLQAGVFAFASELNGLKTMVPLSIDKSHFYSYLRFGSFYGQDTPYKEAVELPAGSCLTLDGRSMEMSQSRWWNIDRYYSSLSTDTFEQSLEKTDYFLRQAIKRRIESSDLEVGCFLSGGIDSGLITAISSEFKRELKTFTISFEKGYDESPLAAQVAKRYGTRHTQINISFAHLGEDLEQILMNYGEPFYDSSAIPSYYVSKEAKKYVTVILNGDGADELFGGYRRYVPFSKYDFFRVNPFLSLGATVLNRCLPFPKDKMTVYNYLYRLCNLSSKSGLEVYLSAGVDIFEDFERKILSPGYDYLAAARSDFDRIAGSKISGLKKVMELDFDINLFCDFLVKMDIATMANSLEGRSPFLAKELLEYLPTLEDRYKVQGKVTKVLLRKLAERYLPADLITQPKRGFEIPLKNWVDQDLKEIIFDYLGSPDCLYREFLEKGFVDDLMAGKIHMPPEKRAKILWTIFSMEVWYKKIYKNRV